MLDVLCGTGGLAVQMRGAFPRGEGVGVDLVAGMLAKCQARWKQHADAVFQGAA